MTSNCKGLMLAIFVKEFQLFRTHRSSVAERYDGSLDEQIARHTIRKTLSFRRLVSERLGFNKRICSVPI